MTRRNRPARTGKKILSATDDIGAKGRDIYSNYGRINVAKALGLK